MRRYNETIKADVKRRMSPPARQSVAQISKELGIQIETLLWFTDFVDWYNHRHRPRGVKFLAPVKRQNGSAIAICQQRVEAYENARRANQTRWRRHTLRWRQPEEAWINKLIEAPNPNLEPPLTQAAYAAAEESQLS